MENAGVLVLSGPPCAGKSSVGRLLPAAFTSAGQEAVHVEVDALFALLLPRSDRGRADRMLAYDAAHAVAALAVKRGRTVVLECTYARQEQRLSLVQAMAVPEAPLRIVEFHIPPDEAVQRFRQRTEDTDLDEVAVGDRAKAFPYSPQALRLDSSTSTPSRLAAALTQWLRNRPAPVHPAIWAAAGRSWA